MIPVTNSVTMLPLPSDAAPPAALLGSVIASAAFFVAAFSWSPLLPALLGLPFTLARRLSCVLCIGLTLPLRGTAPPPLAQHGLAEDWDFQVTPRVISPATQGALISERLFMLRGTFNLGYFVVRARPQSLAFLEWWKHFCLNLGADALEARLFVDHKPADLLPSFVDKVSVLRHPGCNVARWNTLSDGREVRPDLMVTHVGDTAELIFFHFSNLHRASDPAQRLVANPLIQFRDTPGARLRMAEHPILEKLYAYYESLVLPWQNLARKLSDHALPVMKVPDEQAFVRQPFAEAMMQGMGYPNDPFHDAPRTVGWRCGRCVTRHASKSNWSTAISSVRNLLRLRIAPRLLSQAHQN